MLCASSVSLWTVGRDRRGLGEFDRNTNPSSTIASGAGVCGGADRAVVEGGEPLMPEAAMWPVDARRVAQEYLNPAGFVTVVAGPLERIRAARHPRWPVALNELEAELLR